MTFTTLTVISLAALLGPLLALPRQWRLPVVLGELAAGILLGPSAVGYLHPQEPTFAFLANVGFALVMFVAGSHIPVRDPDLRAGLLPGALRALGVAAVALPLGFGIAALFHSTGHGPLYTVLVASSSAALVLPVIDSLRLTGTAVVQLLPQVALADAACIIALPVAIDPPRAGRAALGALAVMACAAAAWLMLRQAERSGARRRVHRISGKRGLALELRLSLLIVFALAALASVTHVSVLLAGFACGVVVAAVGEPRRLARQLFAVTEGFLGPLFFVWLGASLDLRQLAQHPSFVLLGLVLGAAAIAAHAATRLTRQPLPLGVLAAAQLGVPIAAATLGAQRHLLRPGEPAALLLGALLTVAAATACAALLARARR